MNLKYLKKCIFLLFTIILILMTLSSCSLLQDAFSDPLENIIEPQVRTLRYWQIQHNSGTNDYSVFFAFEDEKGEEIAAAGTAKIRLEDEEGNVLYSKSVNFGKSNFGYYSNEILGEHYYARIRIKDDEVSLASSKSGTLYLTVYKIGSYSFEEVNATALYCFNVKDAKLVAEGLPKEVVCKGYDDSIEAKITIDGVTSKFESDTTCKMEIEVTGTKIYGKVGSYSMYDKIDYKIYDSEGFVADTGTLFLDKLSVGDKFKESITLYDAKPGQTYTIKFENG